MKITKESLINYFFPQKTNIYLYSIKLAIYSGFLGTLINSVMHSFFMRPKIPIIKGFDNILWILTRELILAPIIVTLLISIIIKILAKINIRSAFSCIISAFIISALSSYDYLPRMIIVYPLFLMVSLAFSDWLKESFQSAVKSCVIILFIYGISPCFSLINFR